MQYADYTIHPWAQKVPEMSPRDYAELKAWIKSIGQQHPIITHKGAIADGRNRLKACLELGIEPRFEEYTGTLPIEQYILSTNIRRNLTKLQREQMMADFAPAILPQIDEEMEHRRQEGMAKANQLPGKAGGGKSEVREDSRGLGQTWEEGHPGTAAICERTGATSWQARNLRQIHNDAPELLSEVAARGGLTETAKEARKRKMARKAAAKAKQKVKTNGSLSVNNIRALTREEVDPELADKPFEFAAKYGFVASHTKEQIEADKEKAAFSKWVNAIKGLKAPLKELLAVGSFKQSNVESWIKRASDPAKFPLRYAEMYEMVSLIKQAGDSVSELFEWLPTQKPQS